MANTSFLGLRSRVRLAEAVETMAKDESELVPMNKEPGYGGTDADEESKKPDIDISDFKPAAPTWVLDCAQINPCVKAIAGRCVVAAPSIQHEAPSFMHRCSTARSAPRSRRNSRRSLNRRRRFGDRRGRPYFQYTHVFATVHRRAPALAAPDHRVRAALRRRVDERAGRRLGACSLQGVHKYELYLVSVKILDVSRGGF